MNVIKELYNHLLQNDFQIIFLLLLLNLFTVIAPTEMNSLLILVTEFLPNFLKDYLSQISIEPTIVFQAYKIILLFQFFLLLYILIGYKFYFSYIYKAKHTFENSYFLFFILILINNLLDRMDLLDIGFLNFMQFYFSANPNSHSLIDSICTFMIILNCFCFIFLVVYYLFQTD